MEGSWLGWSGDRSDLEGRKHNADFIQAKMKTSAFKKSFKIILKIFWFCVSETDLISQFMRN